LSNILKCDFHRLSKSKLLYGVLIFTALISFSIMQLIRQDIRIGISVFGDLTAFRGIGDIVSIGIQYYNGLGLLIAVLLSVFIGQEYQWKTWQHKWIINKSRSGIYLSKAVFSVAGSVLVFLIYQITALVTSGQISNMLTEEYIAKIIGGIFVYAALGSVICLLAMLIKSNTASIIVCVCYVLFSETAASLISGIENFSESIGRFLGFGIKHSIYGMSTIISSLDFTIGHIAPILINASVIIVLSTTLGAIIFHRYEL